jgi:hypothetical protein
MVVDDVRQVLANDMATGGSEDIADKKDIHLEMLAERVIRCSAWHRMVGSR